MLEHKEEIPRLYELSFGKRPAEELYNLKSDPAQIENVAAEAKYQTNKRTLSARLEKYLKQTNDPRMGTEGEVFEHYPIWRAIRGSDPQSYVRLDRGARTPELAPKTSPTTK